ncbi:hypothetical protein GHL01_00470 [Sinorhizobium meliloti]|uniref:hypothetical protein n=1 Tax=Rhizobium meliloti TaxID=382 RepID=UPI001295C519|nr:hypothetical protein [Sinorhizobium meliloti]MQV12219.1 hypothetical protein [Sinorhizobium meliloti]
MSEIQRLQKGQKVVLERDFDPEVRASAPGDGVTLPQIGQVYTVRDTVVIAGFGDVLFLDEIVNPKKFFLDAFDVVEQGFDPTRFRLVTRHNPAPMSFEAISAWVATVDDVPDLSEMPDDERRSIEELDAINRRWKDWCSGRGCIDPVQEVKAVHKALNGGVITRRQAAAQLGRDIEEVDAENAQDRAKHAEMAALWGDA